MGTRSVGIGRGLAPLQTGVGTLITFATQPGNVALDGKGSNSPFTKALVKYIETPGEDIAVILRRVRQEVIEQTDGKQVPWGNSSLTGSVILKPAVSREPGRDGTEDATAAALREQLEEMQLQLKHAQEKLGNRPTRKGTLAKAGPGSNESTKENSDVVGTNNESAALMPNEDKLSAPAAMKLSLAAQNFERAKKIGTKRGWQLFNRKHGTDPVYGPMALKKFEQTWGPEAENFLDLAMKDKAKIQTALNLRGFEVGAADGLFGSKTRSAIRDFQLAAGVSNTGTDRKSVV